MLDGRVLEASQVEYKPFGKPPLKKKSWGPLRFVDSMNVFPTSLASMIDDLRACTHKQLPELFPLMASLHPELQLRTPTGSPPRLLSCCRRRWRWGSTSWKIGGV